MEIEPIIDNDTEYILIITLLGENQKEIYYYTRIIFTTQSDYQAQIEYVKNFSECTFDEERFDEVSSNLEPDASLVDNSNLGFVNIHSNYSRITWMDFEPEKITKEKIKITEIINDVACISMDYTVKIPSTGTGIEEYYNITEFYRVRVDGEKIYLLDFEREMQQIFEPDSDNTGKRTMNLGIDTDLNMDVITDENGIYTAFVNSRTLWLADTEKEEVIKVFSFFEKSDTDYRKIHREYDIEVIRLDESGNLQFLVYGYMNSGEHEGCVGIALYEFSREESKVEEIVFIPSNRGYPILKEMIGDSVYVSETGFLYMVLDDYIYSVDLSGKEYVEIASGVEEGNYTVSYDKSMVAWHVGGSENQAEEIMVLNLETGESSNVKAGAGTKIKALGFLDEDLVYGIALDENINQDLGELYPFLMTQVCVIDKNGNILQTEEGGGLYFTGATSEDNCVILNRVRYLAGTGYEAADDLTIFSFGEKKAEAEVSVVEDEYKKKVLKLTLPGDVELNGTPTITKIEEILFENTNALSVRELSSKSEHYFCIQKARWQGFITLCQKQLFVEMKKPSGVGQLSALCMGSWR
jgi:hypothetical protein